MPEQAHLTQLSSCAGCAAKLSQRILGDLLRMSPSRNGNASRNGDRNVLVNSDTFDDAGVYQIARDLALVQTVDFFTPIVDDPYDFGQIAAANAISDVYAMGGRPITALNLLGIPPDKVSPKNIVTILRGGAEKAKEVACTIIGGHTIRIPEPVYGLSVTGTVHPKRILTNATAKPGDVLVLTKPLGTGIATTAIKRGLASRKLARAAIESMKRVNVVGAYLAERELVRCATDVTGFGLMGHLGNIVRASRLRAEISAEDVPVFSEEVRDLVRQDCVPGGTRTNVEAADEIADWGSTPPETRVLLCDAQTSGGLLLSVPPKNLKRVLALLKRRQTLAAARIGTVTRGSPAIVVR